MMNLLEMLWGAGFSISKPKIAQGISENKPFQAEKNFLELRLHPVLKNKTLIALAPKR